MHVFEQAANVMRAGASGRSAAKQFGIDQTTFRQYLKKASKGSTNEVRMGYAHHRKIFTDKMEKDLAKHCISLVKVHHGLFMDKVKMLAYEFAAQNQVPIPQNWVDDKKAGREWMSSFMKRHDLSLRTPEATTVGRATSFNRYTVEVFFKNIADVMDRYHFAPENIYNMDETGCFTTQNPPKVIALKGARQVGAVTFVERGTLVTMVGTINAIGNTVPPFFIFPRVRFVKESMLAGAPLGSDGCATKSGWINEEIFVKYLEHFIHFTKCSADNPVLLIMDNHPSHISLEASLMGRKHGIVIVTIHPHTSYKLQPLDRTVFGPFKRYYNSAFDNWMKENPGTTFSIYGIAQLVKQAFELAFTQKNIKSGFQRTGICPLNPDVFTEDDYAPSAVTDRPPLASTTEINSSCQEPAESPPVRGILEENNPCENHVASDPLPETDASEMLAISCPANEHVDTSNSLVAVEACKEADTPESRAHELVYRSPSDIIPLPKAPIRIQTRKRKKGR